MGFIQYILYRNVLQRLADSFQKERLIQPDALNLLSESTPLLFLLEIRCKWGEVTSDQRLAIGLVIVFRPYTLIGACESLRPPTSSLFPPRTPSFSPLAPRVFAQKPSALLDGDRSYIHDRSLWPTAPNAWAALRSRRWGTP